MITNYLQLVLTFTIVTILLIGFSLMFLKAFYQRVEQGSVLIVHRVSKEPLVSFQGAFVFPVIHKAEKMDITMKIIKIDRLYENCLVSKDNVKIALQASFFVFINKTKEDVLLVASMIGCKRASEAKTLKDIFASKFSEALKNICQQLTFEEIKQNQEHFRDKVIMAIGQDLNGYVLGDLVIDSFKRVK